MNSYKRLILGCVGIFLSTITTAEPLDKVLQDQLTKRIVILERAARNREVAALTQMSYARHLQQQSDITQSTIIPQEGQSEIFIHKKIGDFEKKADIMYGLAADNFDLAVANMKIVLDLITRLKREDAKRAKQSYLENLKSQSDLSLELAATACENAVLAFDKANDAIEVANASQQAALRLEKLGAR